MGTDDERKSSEQTTDGFTSNEDLRWDHLTSIVTVIVIITFLTLTVLIAIGEASLEPISTGWFSLLWLVVSATVGWLFGPELVNKYSQYKKK